MIANCCNLESRTMKLSHVLSTAFALTASGVAGAHEGAHVVAHAHPHFGAEHLLFAVIAVAATAGFAIWRRGG